jgi:hypothetical protein
MRRILRHRPSPAMVIACIALAIALGGTSYAAISLPAGSVGTKQLKRNAVNSAKVKNRSLLAVDFKRGQLPRGAPGARGATGATGAQGIQGAPGQNGANGANGVNGATGPRGPSDVYEVVLSAASVQAAGTTRTLTLSNLPAGAYAIFGKALLANTQSVSSSQCTLTAGSTSDYSYHRFSEINWYAHINTQLTHTFASTGSVAMACTVFTGTWQMSESGTNDTKIIAVRVDTQTRTVAAATVLAGVNSSGAGTGAAE